MGTVVTQKGETVFTSKQTMAAREVRSAHAKLTALLAARDTWYDGSVESVDARLADINHALPVVARVAERDSAMLTEAERLRQERKDLLSLRADLLTNTSAHRTIPRKSAAGPMTREARRFIDLELRQFLADNADAIDDPDELDERAENFAELATFQVPMATAKSVVAHFRLAVNWASKPKRAARQVRVASVDHFDDSMLFE